ncbi:Ldh family oxidoreductase [Kineococcus arenarius]|uniref:Ldh family oxidoreductase n=1 Tax=unclassified Kineococcus TaxID=2621656 RepID=UPI003D7C86CD
MSGTAAGPAGGGTTGEPPEGTTSVPVELLEQWCRQALTRAGMTAAAAEPLAAAVVDAEARGKTTVGVNHLFDYLEAVEAGRLDPAAVPEVRRPSDSLFVCDARGGSAHTGFAQVLADLVAAARRHGSAVFSQHGAYTCGHLGWFTTRLAGQGLVALAVANSPALMAAPGTSTAVFGTNPLSLAAPAGAGPTLVIDQAASHTAFVNIREAAEHGEEIPAGWAVDGSGRPTTDAGAALGGALLPAGGYKGANTALVVEVLAALSGASWSMDAPPFQTGNANPGVGVFVLALAPESFGAGFGARLGEQLDRLAAQGMRVPGRPPGKPADPGPGADGAANGVPLPAALVSRLRSAARA